MRVNQKPKKGARQEGQRGGYLLAAEKKGAKVIGEDQIKIETRPLRKQYSGDGLGKRRAGMDPEWKGRKIHRRRVRKTSSQKSSCCHGMESEANE